MDNKINKLISKEKVEDILNSFGNIGDNNTKLSIKNLLYYQTAFVHESYFQSVQNAIINNELINIVLNYIPERSNEQLEFLGDTIIKGVLGRYLIERFPNEREGFLTKIKIKMEKTEMFYKFGINLGFKEYLLISTQVENQTILATNRGRNTPSYYEDVFEAFIGAIIMDFEEKGYIYVDRFLRNVIENLIDFSDLISRNDNFKDSLQRYYQSPNKKWPNPTYITLFEKGPLYRRVFCRVLKITKDQYNECDDIVKNNINNLTKQIKDEYKVYNNENFEEDYIVGIGLGKKLIEADQMCAKKALQTFYISENY